MSHYYHHHHFIENSLSLIFFYNKIKIEKKQEITKKNVLDKVKPLRFVISLHHSQSHDQILRNLE